MNEAEIKARYMAGEMTKQEAVIALCPHVWCVYRRQERVDRWSLEKALQGKAKVEETVNAG